MNPTTSVTREVQSLIEAVCDGMADDAQVRDLESLLLTDEEARNFYVDLLDLDAKLQRLVGSRQEGDVALKEFVAAEQTPPQQPAPIVLATPLPGTVGFFASGWPVAYLVATAIFGIGLLIGSFTPVSQPAQVASRSSVPSRVNAEPKMELVGRITGMVDCKWAGRALDSPSVPLGRKYELASGLMEITYDSGAKVILQGPVTYEVESATGGHLSVGKLTARIAKKAEESDPQSLIPNPLFVVCTPSATVTDLGTEFGVEVGQDGRTEVHVLHGVVEARPAGIRDVSPPAQRVAEGCAVEIAAKADQFKVIAFAPRSFIRTLQPPTETPSETAYINAVLADKPMGYWPLNEPAGSRKVFDRSGNEIHGYAMRKVAMGQPGPLSAQSRAVGFDGLGHIDFGRRDQFAMQNDFTVEAWVWIGKVKQCSKVISVFGKNDDRSVGWGLSAGRIRPGTKSDTENPVVLYFSAFGDPGDFIFPLPSSESIEGRWLHVAVVFDRVNAAHLYLNGRPRGSVPKSRPARVGPVWLQIGCTDVEDLDAWRGRLAHIAVYPRALSGQQIQNHYGQRSYGEKEVSDKQP